MLQWIPNYASTLPLHAQLVKVILIKLNRNELIRGTIIPSAKSLSKQYLVPEYVVTLALKELLVLKAISQTQGKLFFAIQSTGTPFFLNCGSQHQATMTGS